MQVALYARISTIDKGQDTELQLRDLRKYAEARGWTVFGEYIDKCSGSKDKRPELDRLLEGARKRKFNAILVWRLDRFSRSLKHLITALDELRGLGVSFYSFSENIDLSSSTGQLLFHLLGAFAEFERNLIKERVKAGIANARAKGKIIGRRPLIDTGDLWTVKDMRGRGMSIRQIAEACKLSKSSVHKTLKKIEQENLENTRFKNNEMAVL